MCHRPAPITAAPLRNRGGVPHGSVGVNVRRANHKAYAVEEDERGDLLSKLRLGQSGAGVFLGEVAGNVMWGTRVRVNGHYMLHLML